MQLTSAVLAARPGPVQAREREAERRDGTGVEEIAARKAVAESGGAVGIQSDHVAISKEAAKSPRFLYLTYLADFHIAFNEKGNGVVARDQPATVTFTLSISDRPDLRNGRGIGWAWPFASIVRQRSV